MDIGTKTERTTRLSNALSYSKRSNAPGWAILLAEDEKEARSIVLDVARSLDVKRTSLFIRGYPAPRPDSLVRFRVGLIA